MKHRITPCKIMALIASAGTAFLLSATVALGQLQAVQQRVFGMD